MAKNLREHKNKFEDHGNKTTVKEIKIKTLKALVVRDWNKWGGGGRGGARAFVYRRLKRNNRKLG